MEEYILRKTDRGQYPSNAKTFIQIGFDCIYMHFATQTFIQNTSKYLHQLTCFIVIHEQHSTFLTTHFMHL